MTPSNRLAKEKLRLFEALAAYANMGDTPAEWKKFDLKYPDFFPQDLARWMYGLAEDWHKFPAGPARNALPPLLWYRNRLRSVWGRTDQHGYNLALLLGFEEEAEKILSEHRGEIGFESHFRSSVVPGRTIVEMLDDKVKGLPKGKAAINGVTGQIRWEFGCTLQHAVYELMQERWRAKICPACGRFFVAMKTAQKSCSLGCSGDAKRERALSWWHEKGSERRSEAKQIRQPKGKKTI